MKLVPLFDRVVLKQLVAESPVSCFRVRQKRNRSRQKSLPLDRAELWMARKLPCR